MMPPPHTEKNDQAGGGGRGGWVLLYIKHIKSYKIKGWVLLHMECECVSTCIECDSTFCMCTSISQIESNQSKRN